MEFLERNLVDKIYKPIIQREIDAQLQKDQEEDRELDRVRDELAAMQREVARKKAAVEEKRLGLEALQAEQARQGRELQALEEKVIEGEAQV